MFTTILETEELTGYVLPLASLVRAQGIIESYIGRTEADVDVPQDFEMLGRAVAYQAAYMEHDLPRIFGQARTQQLLQYGNMVSYFDDGVSPFVAPLAVLACRRLSWRRMRSIRTGSIYATRVREGTWATE